MALPQPSIVEYRQFLLRGCSAVRGQLRTTPYDASLRQGLCEYCRSFGMLDAMTALEKATPFEVIDSGRIRRIARGAGVKDPEVIQLLFSFRDFCEQLMRARWTDGQGGTALDS